MSTPKFKWTVEFTVDASWVADGFEITAERAHDMLAATIGGAFNHEISAKVLKAPPQAAIRKVQGYTSKETT